MLDSINPSARHRTRPAPAVALSPQPSQPEDILVPLVPLITRRDIRAMNEMFSDSDQGTEDQKRPLKFARSHYPRVIDRYLIGILKPAAYTVLGAIYSRTLPWKKVIEIISLDTFCHGIDGTDRDGLPYFSGVKLSRLTVRLTLDELAKGRFIERFAINDRGRIVHAYMPASAFVMMCLTSQGVSWSDVPASVDKLLSNGTAPKEHEMKICNSVAFMRRTIAEYEANLKAQAQTEYDDEEERDRYSLG